MHDIHTHTPAHTRSGVYTPRQSIVCHTHAQLTHCLVAYLGHVSGQERTEGECLPFNLTSGHTLLYLSVSTRLPARHSNHERKARNPLEHSKFIYVCAAFPHVSCPSFYLQFVNSLTTLAPAHVQPLLLLLQLKIAFLDALFTYPLDCVFTHFPLLSSSSSVCQLASCNAALIVCPDRQRIRG